MTPIIYINNPAEQFQTRHSERSEESRKKQYLCVLVIKSVWHQLHADVWADWVKFFESRIQLSAIADGRWTAAGLLPLFSSHRLFLRVLHPQTPHKVSDLDLKDAERILSRSRTRQTCQIIHNQRTLDLSTDFLKLGFERQKLLIKVVAFVHEYG